MRALRPVVAVRGVLAVLALLAGLAAGAGAQSPLGLDLVEINVPSHPLDPGVHFTFQPASGSPPEAPGIAVADFNNDSFLDMLVCGVEGHANELYVNLGNGTFQEAAVGKGVAEPTKRRGQGLFVDFDNDGDLDLLTCGYPGEPTILTNLYTLFRNNGPPGYDFTDVTSSAGGFILGPSVETTTIGVPGGAAVADYNGDGYADVIVTYWHNNFFGPGAGDLTRDQFRLWKNVPNPVGPGEGQPNYSSRKFVDATQEAGLDGVGNGSIWMPSWTDFNRDGRPDLHINVELGPDELRLNNGDGTFSGNVASAAGMNFNAGDWGNEMGCGLADFDNDGDIDCVNTNAGTGQAIKADAFYRNDSDFSLGGAGLRFTHVGPQTGTDAVTGIGWGVTFADLDNDGDKDLLTVRGLGAAKAPNRFFRNLFPQRAADGITVAFEDVSPAVTDFSTIGCTTDVARSLAAFDFDNDGDLDLATTRTGFAPNPLPGDNLRAGFFLNTLGNGNAWMQLSLKETGGGLFTTGTRVSLRTGGVNGVTQLREVITGSSFLGQEPARLHFGLGSAASADWVAIRWPNGTQKVIRPDGPRLAGFRTVTHDVHDATGDLDGDADADGDDLAFFVQGLKHVAAVNALLPDFPWQLMADADGNGVRDGRDFTQLRKAIAVTAVSLGNGLAGTHDVPNLTATGPLTAGSLLALQVADARESSSCWLVMGFSVLGSNFKGGTMVPSVDLLLGPFPTDAAGALLLAAPMPALPPGLALQFQGWITDAAALNGFAASNGVSLLVP